MLQMDFRGSTGPKRARTDDAGARGEGDWTCPQCGNMNFAFRTTCNMRKCATPKPVDGGQKGMGGPLGPAIYDQAPAPMYMGGPGAPPTLSLGYPSTYGAPMIMPQQNAVAVSYDYNASMNNVASYQQIQRPVAYAPSGNMMGGGPAYGAPPVLDPYGMNMNMGPQQMDSMQMPPPRALGNYGDENGSRKRRGGPDGLSEGDWLCPKCGNTNFAFRTTCNMRKCGATKPNENNRFNNAPHPRAPPATQGPPPDGSWTCEACGNVNYPFRAKCNRRNCGADKPTDTKPPAAVSSPPPPSDQVCNVCVCMPLQVKVSVSMKKLLLLLFHLFWSKSSVQWIPICAFVSTSCNLIACVAFFHSSSLLFIQFLVVSKGWKSIFKRLYHFGVCCP